MLRFATAAAFLSVLSWSLTTSLPSSAQVEQKTAASAPDEPATNREKPLAVGDTAPNFRLKDQQEKIHSLDDLLKKHERVALVFYRSAGWCPFCRKHLIELQKNLEKISATQTQLVGISYDSIDVLKKFATQSEIGFPLLSDEGSKMIHAYGVHHQKGYPHPGTYVIGKDRKILAALFNEGYRDRHKPQDLLKAIEQTTK